MFDVFFLHLCVLQALEKCRDIQDEPVYDIMHIVILFTIHMQIGSVAGEDSHTGNLVKYLMLKL